MVLETHTGLYLDYADPKPEQISLEDIAHSLSLTCRYGGHSKRFFSVAEHAVNVAELVWYATRDKELAYGGLHHDSHEAYTGDIPSPLKALLGQRFRTLADRLDVAIGAKLGIDPKVFKHPEVKRADALALRIEAQELKTSRGLGEYWGNHELIEGYAWATECLDADAAKRMFLDTDRFCYR